MISPNVTNVIFANVSEATTVISTDVRTTPNMVSVSATEMTTAVPVSTSIKGTLKNYAKNN